MGEFTLPTDFRHLLSSEWDICTKVFGSTLPAQTRILLSNGLGAGGAPFTAPARVITNALRYAMPAIGLATRYVTFAGHHGWGGGHVARATVYLDAANTDFVINVGQTHSDWSTGIAVPVPCFPDLTRDTWTRETLVHEMVHVWQGHHSNITVAPTIASLAAQCTGLARSGRGGGLAARNSAYVYDLAVPPDPPIPWEKFNPEQQAQIVMHWYNNGMKTTGDPRYYYIETYIRKGRMS